MTNRTYSRSFEFRCYDRNSNAREGFSCAWYKIIFAKCNRRGHAAATYERLRVIVEVDIAYSIIHLIGKDFVDVMKAKELKVTKFIYFRK